MAMDRHVVRSGEEAPRASVRLRVARARDADIGTGSARLGPGTFQRLGLAVGDVIELAGKRHTTAIALRLQFEDRGLEVVRIEGLVRANAGAVLGESVDVRRAAVDGARRVTLTLTASVSAEPPPLSGDAVHRAMLGRVLNTGDLISVPCGRITGTELMRISATGGLDPPADPPVDIAEIRFRVAFTEPDGNVRVLPTTKVDLNDDVARRTRAHRTGVTYDDVGGLTDAIAQLRETVELPLARPDLFRRLGITPPRGVLLHGPSGSGKTLLAKAVAGEAGARLLIVDSAGLIDGHGTSLEETLAAVFQQAREQAPSIVLLDNLDAIAPSHAASGGSERRLVTRLVTHIDDLGSTQDVVLIGTASTSDMVDDGLRRPGRLDREIAVGPLDLAGRREVLAIHARHVPLAADVDLDHLSGVTLGFTGGDLAALLREAAVATIRRALADGTPGEIQAALAQPLEVGRRDFDHALSRTRPAAMREHAVDLPAVRWSDIGGLEDVKRALRDGIEFPITHADAFARLGIRASKGFLLFGPPGTGKTTLARAVAHEAGANFIAVRPSDLLSKWYGESERQVVQLFARARRLAPTILFFDEIEALVPRRGASMGEPAVTERVVNALLMEFDGLEELRGVVAIGATNQPALIDPALLRPGRIDELIYVPAPTEADRLHILALLTNRTPLAADVDLGDIAGRTPRYTGADLEGLVRRAGFRAFCENTDACEVRMAHFEKALADTRASLTVEMEREYETMLGTLRCAARTRHGAIGFARDEEE